ncbi:MAG: hypothetical protein QG622_2920 [Actinomycetota bacterium]|nr:hypothetical protein [Actinomycetota bacterium]
MVLVEQEDRAAVTSLPSRQGQHITALGDDESKIGYLIRYADQEESACAITVVNTTATAHADSFLPG